jgi:ureidoglycolate lyase
MAEDGVEWRHVPLIDATPENFAPFGTLLGDVVGSDRASSFYSSVRVANPATNFAADDSDGHLIVLCYQPRPFEVKFMERHYKHTQVFIPLEGKPLVGFFAPANDKEEPDLDKVVALRFDGSAGFCMNKGTWHEQPFPVEANTKAICFLRKETMTELKPPFADMSTGECHGNDIDKLNIKDRRNVMFKTDPPNTLSAKVSISCTSWPLVALMGVALLMGVSMARR